MDNGALVRAELTLSSSPPLGQLELPLSSAIEDALYQTKKINSLYSHQASALNHLQPSPSSTSKPAKGVIISTSTSSGKSLIYQIPVLRALEQDPQATAVYIFPTKALAQDQKRALAEVLGCCEGLEGVKVRCAWMASVGFDV